MAERSPAELRDAAQPSGNGSNGNGADWPVQATDTIVKVVGQVRDATTTKALTAARGVVYGLLAGLLGGVIAVLLAIAGVRLLVVLLPDGSVWAAHLIIGLVFVVGGIVLWSQRHRAPDEG